MKHLSVIIASLVIMFGGALMVSAQSYTPLAPLPGTFTGTETAPSTDLTTYLAGMIKLLIATAGAAAILVAIIGGTQYVASGITPDAKNNAKDRIQNAFIGLALVLTSYLILNSINPKLVQFNLLLPPVGAPATTPTGVAVTPPTGTWPDDANERAQLLPVTINKSNCTVADPAAPGGSNCTSVYGLQSDVTTAIKNLRSACNCSVIVTAGTEYWLHRSHNNNRRVDLSKETVLDAYITKTGTSSSTSCGVSSDPHYQTDGAMYVDEPNRDANGSVTGTGRHWHVCY